MKKKTQKANDDVSKKTIAIREMVNDPFKGKGEFVPAPIPETISIRINLNENFAFQEELMKKLLLKAAQKIDPRIYPEAYCESLCEILAEGHHLTPNQIVVANGCDRIIDLAARLTLKSGYSSVIVQPTFVTYEHATKVQGGEVKEFLLTPPPEFALDLDYILSNIRPKKDRLLFLCSPNNPTGNQFEEWKVRRLIEEFPGIVALDETYSDFANYSLVDVLNDYPNLIIMKTFSKLYGMAGMRVGYSLSSEFLASRMKEIILPFNVNAASIELAKLVLQEKKYLAQIIKNTTLERERIYNELQKIEGITPFKSLTSFIMFRTENAAASEVYKKLLSEKILVKNLSALPLCKNCLRMTITTKENNDAFISALKEVLDSEMI